MDYSCQRISGLCFSSSSTYLVGYTVLGLGILVRTSRLLLVFRVASPGTPRSAGNPCFHSISNSEFRASRPSFRLSRRAEVHKPCRSGARSPHLGYGRRELRGSIQIELHGPSELRSSRKSRRYPGYVARLKFAPRWSLSMSRCRSPLPPLSPMLLRCRWTPSDSNFNSPTGYYLVWTRETFLFDKDLWQEYIREEWEWDSPTPIIS